MKDKIKDINKILKNKDLTMTRTNHHFQKWQVDWMEWHKNQTGTSAAELLRSLINEYIQKTQRL
jgi:hypothetical protein